VLETGVKETNTTSGNQSTNQSVNQPGNAPGLSTTSYTENIIAGYFTLTQQLRTLKLQAGLRAEQTNVKLSTIGLDNAYLNFFPAITIEQKVSDKYQVSLAYTSRINRPNYQSLIPFVVPIDNYTQEKGNPNLKAEYANSFELTNTLGSISVTLGYTHTRNAIQDFIEQDLQTKVWTFTKQNFTRAQNYSVALVVPFSITSWWSANNTLFGAYNSYYTDNAGGSTYNQGKASYNLNSMNTFLLPAGIKAELIAIYNSANIYGLYQISHSSMINAGFSRAFLDKKMNIKLGVNDIFHGSGYNLSTDAGNIRLNGSSYTDSRRATLSVSYKFGKKVAPARQVNKSNATEQGRLNL
jgi:outer membrane receptor protein involved in Fe transport